MAALGVEGVFFLTGEWEVLLGNVGVLGGLPTLFLGDKVFLLLGDFAELGVLGLPGFFFGDSVEFFGDFAGDSGVFGGLSTLLLGDVLVLLGDLTDELGVLGLPGFFFGDNERLGDFTGDFDVLGLPTFLLGDNLYFTGDFKVDGDLDGLPTLFGDSKAPLGDFKAVESGVLGGLPTFLLAGDSKVCFGDLTEDREVPGD